MNYRKGLKDIWVKHIEEIKTNQEIFEYWIERIKNDIAWRIENLNNKHLREDTILYYIMEIEVLTECLNIYDKTLLEHESFNAKLEGINKYCEWDKKYYYEFLVPGEKSTKYVFVKKFDNWIKHKLNCKDVKGYIVDNVQNILNLEV